MCAGCNVRLGGALLMRANIPQRGAAGHLASVPLFSGRPIPAAIASGPARPSPRQRFQGLCQRERGLLGAEYGPDRVAARPLTIPGLYKIRRHQRTVRPKFAQTRELLAFGALKVCF
jgi:hypothetical protein